MALSYKARRRLSLLVLLVGLPVYVLVASVLGTWLNPQNVVLKLLLYIVLGVAWIIPCKPIFQGVGKADPDTEDTK